MENESILLKRLSHIYCVASNLDPKVTQIAFSPTQLIIKKQKQKLRFN